MNWPLLASIFQWVANAYALLLLCTWIGLFVLTPESLFFVTILTMILQVVCMSAARAIPSKE